MSSTTKGTVLIEGDGTIMVYVMLVELQLNTTKPSGGRG